MGRKIDISFDDKTYTIEFDRATTLMLVNDWAKGGQNDVNSIIKLFRYGLEKHHSKEMPSDDEIAGWILAMDDVEGLVQEITKLVQDVLSAVKDDSGKAKNLKWGVRN